MKLPEVDATLRYVLISVLVVYGVVEAVRGVKNISNAGQTTT